MGAPRLLDSVGRCAKDPSARYAVTCYRVTCYSETLPDMYLRREEGVQDERRAASRLQEAQGRRMMADIKVRVTTGLERGMVFTLKEVSGGWYAGTGRTFKREWPWRFRLDELELYVPWWKRLWSRRPSLVLPVTLGNAPIVGKPDGVYSWHDDSHQPWVRREE